jgi:hypothetical protein
MAKSLEDMLRDLAARGELSYLSIIPSPGGFEATYSPASKFGHVFARDADPATALMLALKNAPKLIGAARRSRVVDIDPEVAELLS